MARQTEGGDIENRQRPVGVWNRGTKRGPHSPIRVRTKRLDEIQGDKIALAYWLLAKKIVEDGSDQPVSESEARRVASELEQRNLGEDRTERGERG